MNDPELLSDDRALPDRSPVDLDAELSLDPVFHERCADERDAWIDALEHDPAAWFTLALQAENTIVATAEVA